MNEKPILFSGPMVRAILEGRKTQTRRCHIKPKSLHNREFHYLTNDLGYPASRGHLWAGFGRKDDPVFVKLPYQVGDLLWVRETWAPCHLSRMPDGEAVSVSDRLAVRAKCDLGEQHIAYRADGEDGFEGKWRPSIFMPKWAARLWLKVTKVRVERLQEITREDALAEGCGEDDTMPDGTQRIINGRKCFRVLWDSLNAKRGYGWDKNPWVAVYEFERTDKP